jgi:hypothetical protein
LHQHPSDRGVGGIRQRRVPAVARPIAVAGEIRVRRGDLAQRLEVVVRNGVDRLDGSGELRPARRPVAASEDELRVGERRDRGIDPPGMELAEVVERRRRLRADVAQQILRLVAPADRDVDGTGTGERAYEPPSCAPVVRSFGLRRFVRRTGQCDSTCIQVDSVLPADRRRPVRRSPR